MSLEPDTRTPSEPAAPNWWDSYDATYVTPEALAAVPERTPMGEWPLHVRDAVNGIGLDYDAVIKDIQTNPEKYDAVWEKHQDEFQMTGQGGVPTMSFGGEPFFGQDRFNQLFWRLRQNGLTARKVPREPMVARPLRWPSSPGGE